MVIIGTENFKFFLKSISEKLTLNLLNFYSVFYLRVLVLNF